MRIALAQFDPVIGDIESNTRRHAELIAQAVEAGADLVVFSELSVVGYPPRDLLGKDGFVAASVRAVESLAGECTQIAALVGFVRPTPGQGGRPLQNCAALLRGGRVEQVHVKRLLPTYDVFDETRYFQPGDAPGLIDIAGRTIGITICEDLWDAESLGRALYDTQDDPVQSLRRAGAECIVNLAASPFEVGKPDKREALFARQATRAEAPIVYVNQVGGNDELIFDGFSSIIAADGAIRARAAGFTEDLIVADPFGDERVSLPRLPGSMDQLAEALKLGLRDYAHKCGFSDVVFGLSGGIDSALVATLAADALGPEHVMTLLMPSRYSSGHSVSDAEQLAGNLGIRTETVAIEAMHQAFEREIARRLADGDAAIAEENIQARIRGCLVMAWSNAYNLLPLATGNKSELSVGYCTLYGDMVGGLAPIGDVLKTDVYALCRHLNEQAGAARIPEHILTKPPSAELKPDQTDQDKLPPYDTLDDILRRYVEQDHTAHEISDAGFDRDLVARIVRMVDRSEYKRQQAARVLKVSSRAFGIGRRMPIAQRFS
jgi:NAD+ synthetase